MARFRGTVQGGRGMASRLGHGTTGLEVTAQTWSDDVRVILSAQKDDAGDDQDYAAIYLGSYCLYYGPVTRLRSEEGIVDWVTSHLARNRSVCGKVMEKLAYRSLEEYGQHEEEE